ncbi:MAG: S41 family peptidase [Defluviitaleaceae bacterium]|nr:S41 family peptidase [Defluviitaleaceae bacterium]
MGKIKKWFATGKVWKIPLIAVVFLIIVLMVAAFVFWNMSGRPSFHRADEAQMRTMDFSGVSFEPHSFATDALYLVQLVERTHPIFVVDGWLPDNYEQMRDEFLTYTQNPDITRLEFAFATARYFTTLRDGHMSGWNGLIERDDDNMWSLAIFGDILDIVTVMHNGRMFLREDDTDTQFEVIEIGGVAISQIFDIIDRYYYGENEVDRQNNYRMFSRFGDVIERAGGTIATNGVNLTINTNGEISTMQVGWMDLSVSGAELDYIIRYEIMDDIFYIDLRTFVDGEHITEVVRSIENAVRNDIRNFIVDLRGNGGGNSMAGHRLLEAMGITVPDWGAVRRISPLLFENHSFLWYLRPFQWVGFDYMYVSPNIPENNNPNDVFVSVLTDASSFSSATMMAAWVQDGGFGNIIGGQSRNSPNSFGDILRFQLPYSGFVGVVSYTQWLRPDVNADPINLLPDILVDPSEALDVAIEFLRNLDR